MLRKFIATILAALLLSAGLTVAHTGRAEAATCQLSHVCLWSGAAYTGTLIRYGVSQSTGVTGCHNLVGSTMNNNAESMVNGSYKFINFYNAQSCQGTTVLTWLHASGGSVDERSSLPGAANMITSFRYCGSSSPC
jgi:hypothetical protein